MTAEVFTGIGVKIQGHLKILEYQNQQDYTAGKSSRVLLNKRNAVHKDNASILLAKALTKRVNSNALHTGSIAFMVFGNGGTTLENTGTVVFKTPNDEGPNSNLYNQVFFHMVDDLRGALPGNQMAVRHISNSLFTDCEIRCLIGINEPFSQIGSNMDSGINLNTNPFAFDEIGLKTTEGDLVTHVIFSPVLKTASSLIEVIYTLRVMIAPQGTESPLFLDFFPLTGVQSTAQLGSFGLPVPAFAAKAVEFDGLTSLWDLPAMTNSSSGTISCWLYLPPNFGITPYPGVCDFFNVLGGNGYLLTAEGGLPLFIQCGSTLEFFYAVNSITNNTANAVISLTSPATITGIADIGSTIIISGLNQTGWTAGTTTGRKIVNVISRTANTITTDFNTTGYPAFNPAQNPNCRADIGYVTTISNTNPAVITTSLPHGIDGSSQPFVVVQGLSGSWSSFGIGGSPPQVLSTTANTITINADATARGAFNPLANGEPRIYILNSFTLDFSDHDAGNGSFYNWQSTTPVPPSQWTNVLISWDMNHPSGNKVAQVYYGDTATAPIWIQDDYAGFTIPYSLGTPNPLTGDNFGWKIAGNGLTNTVGSVGYMSEFWYAPGVFTDFSNATNRHKFHDAITGKAISLGTDGSLPTGVKPEIYLSLNNQNSTTPDPAIVFIDPLGRNLEQNPATLGGVADSHSYVLSFWIDRNTKLFDMFNGIGIFIEGTPHLLPETLSIEVYDASFNRFTIQFDYDAGAGANIAVAVDTNHIIGSKVALVYVNNQLITPTIVHDEIDNLLIHWQDGSSFFQVLSGTVGYIGDIWFAPGQFFDPVNKFSDNFGNPVSVGVNGQIPSGTSPTIFLSLNTGDPASNFGNNKGTGGNFTGATNFLLENGTRFSDNETGNGKLRVTLNKMLLAPTSPTD